VIDRRRAECNRQKGAGERVSFNVELRRLQSLVLLMSCLPPDGKCREIFELALALDNEPILDRLTPPEKLEEPHGFQLWMESILAREGISTEEEEVIWWQNVPENMEVAIREIEAIEDRLGGRWMVS
jgi:hypothetical protein